MMDEIKLNTIKKEPRLTDEPRCFSLCAPTFKRFFAAVGAADIDKPGEMCYNPK